MDLKLNIIELTNEELSSIQRGEKVKVKVIVPGGDYARYGDVQVENIDIVLKK